MQRRYGGVLDERAAHGRHASLLTQKIMRDVVALGDAAITAELERDVHASECEAAQHVLDARLLRPLRAQELAPRCVEEEVPNLDRGPHRVRCRYRSTSSAWPLIVSCQAVSSSSHFETSASAQRNRYSPAPRRESRGSRRFGPPRTDLARRMPAHGKREPSLEIPTPSSRTFTRRAPPPSISTSIRVAPASTLFSTSSLTTDAGRSTASPAAIWLAS